MILPDLNFIDNFAPMNKTILITEVSASPSGWKLHHGSRTLTCGSCFAEVLGNQLSDNKFKILRNPFGTIFNPLSIAKVLEMALDEAKPDPALFFENPDGIWLHFDFHSSIWATDRVTLELKLEELLRDVKIFLKSADALVITLGSAYAYRHKATNQIVGNCHKAPPAFFFKELLNLDQITINLERLIFKLQILNRDLRIVLSVSPVRHTRDTLVLNQVSKSTLRLVTHRLNEKFKQVTYFPAYEIMMDELRDYRYYKEDLIHPSQWAEQYIFNVFLNTFADKGAIEFIKEWQAVRQMLMHKPQHGLTPSYLEFLFSARNKVIRLSTLGNFSRELDDLEKRIAEFPV
jgi:hypothetical protein